MAYEKWSRAESEMARDLYNAGGMTYQQIAEFLNETFGTQRSGEKVRDALRKGLVEQVIKEEAGAEFDRMKVEVMQDGSLSVKADRPYDDDEMFQLWGLDQKQWVVTKRIINTWGGHFQTKLWIAPADPIVDATEQWELYLAEWKDAMAPTAVEPPPQQGKILYEILPYDAHIGMKAWGPETGEDYDLYIGLERLRTAYKALLRRAPSQTGRVLTVVGQDLAHFDQLIDGKGGATAKGTVQDVDTRWQKLFVALCEVWYELINETIAYYPLDVIVQPGNHDTRTSFFVGQWLEARFHNNPRVRFDITPKPRKYYRWGKVLLGFSHGHLERKKMQWDSLMATEAAHDWALTNHREWHLGHLHHESVGQAGEVYVRRMRALTGTDAWHREQGYLARPGMQAFTWHAEDGILNQQYYNVPEEQVDTDHIGVVLSGGD